MADTAGEVNIEDPELVETTINYKEGTYIGQVKKHSDTCHGKGTLTLDTGNKYEGMWKHGKKDGDGTNTLANGDQYVGQW